MEKCHPLNDENLFSKANYLSRLFFFWMRTIIWKANGEGLEIKDFFEIGEQFKSETQIKRVERVWLDEINKKKEPSLLRTLMRAYAPSYLRWGTLVTLSHLTFRIVQPLLLLKLIREFAVKEKDGKTVMILGSAIAFCSLAMAFLNHHGNFGLSITGMKIRVGLSALIYKKVLNLSHRSLAKTKAGYIMNLLATDVTRFDLLAPGLIFLLFAPFQLIIATSLIWYQMGSICLVGLGVLIFLTFSLQTMTGTTMKKFRLKIARKTDKRISLIREILMGIQVIKMYSWERAFKKVVEEARSEEMVYLKKSSLVRAILSSFSMTVQRVVLAVTAVCYVLTGNTLTADLVFSWAMYFNILQMSLGMICPTYIAQGAECLIAIKRSEEFLLMDEKQTTTILLPNDGRVYLNNVSAFWSPPTATLKILSLNLPEGVLCAVIGPVGSGKSSFLNLLLGELVPSTGQLKISENVSYASQESWLFTSSVRNNILFGEDYNSKRYHEVVSVCALEKDFDQFPGRDRSRVEDRGVSLSGGQRARINLARAVYKEADVYLLDDPLSAVDTKVGKHLFEQCILNYLSGKTRILVTHQLQYLKKADTIIVFNNGAIETRGTYEELSRSNVDFTKLLAIADQEDEQAIVPRSKKISMSLSLSKTYSDKKENSYKLDDKGNYNGSVLWAYLKHGGGNLKLLSIFALYIFSQILLSGTDYWLTYWVTEEQIRMQSTLLQPYQIITSVEVFDENQPESFYKYIPQVVIVENTTNFLKNLEQQLTDRVIIQSGEKQILLRTETLMYSYVFLVGSCVILSLIQAIIFFQSRIVASKNLHNNMFRSMLEAPMRFFDTNPAGWILNRFSKDMGAIDEQLPKCLVDVLSIFLFTSGILVMVIISNIYISLVVIVVIFLLKYILRLYVTTTRSVKLIEGIVKSPVFAYVSSSLDGLTTIRARKKQEILLKQFHGHQDVHTSVWYLNIMSTVTFGLLTDLISVLFITLVVFGFIILDKFQPVNGGFIGLGIFQATMLLGMLQYGMRQSAELINNTTCVERVLRYGQLDKEQSLNNPEGEKPRASWPERGNMEFRELNLRYSETDAPVLNNLNLKISSNEKIGIVGRTGAGKSSLIAALFRLAPIEGKILIDDVNTQILELRELRKKISIIPQEPVLVFGSLRYNLDPFNEFTDEELWGALEDVELKHQITSLSEIVDEGGCRYSIGQKQLICLARAILANNRILILDEATANVDLKTDELIQNTIRTKFRNCTVLTIAHRLNTIMDSDRILVMELGRIVEFDPPHVLLQKPSGHFRKMVEDTGPTLSQSLKIIAFDAYEKRITTTHC